MIDEQEIRKSIATLKPNNALYEVRAIDGRWNASGYFRGADSLIPEIKRHMSRTGVNFYITLSTVNEACASRKQFGKMVENASPTTSDSDVVAYEWLMVDVDPHRPTGTSSSDEQIEKSKLKANQIFKFLRSRGWSDPIVSLSGNGTHLLYAIGLANNPENVKLIQNCLLVLDMFFSDEEMQIDLKTFNPARICKLYGTTAKKGLDTTERPHRMSKIIRARKIEQTDKSLLQSLVTLLPQQQKPAKYNGYNPARFDLDNWIYKHGLNVRKTNWNGGNKWIFEECPFDSSHKGKDAAIIQTTDGKICFNCFHNSCAGNKWRELRLKYEPTAYEQKYVESTPLPNYRNPNYQTVPVQDIKPVDGEPIFFTTEQIRMLKTPPEEFIKTGIEVLDKKLRGLKKGFVTCLSGLRGCGKSSLISQFTIEAVEQGYKVALFSGELTAKNLYKWLTLQAAGKYAVQGTQYENYYQVNTNAELQISKWLDEKLYVYNNHYGNNFAEIAKQLGKCVTEHKVDLVILDNLMALNINMLDQDKFARQSAFVEQLETFAKEANIHIIFVAHPRKSMGFLRLDDVSGSNDIVNRVDNAFIIHRVNKDFKRLSNVAFKWKEDDPLYQCDNVIEICKDRDLGTQDVFIPLYFEISCKRLKNSQHEHKNYGWVKDDGGFGDDDWIEIPNKEGLPW